MGSAAVSELSQQLTLARWLLRQLGVASLDELPWQELREQEASRAPDYLGALVRALPPKRSWGDEYLAVLDAGVRASTAAIDGGRDLRWKPFQYLALLLSEGALRASWSGGPYPGGDRLALWLATGAGKTLLMHAQLRQHQRLSAAFGRPEPDRVVLVAPNRALVDQHLERLARSGIPAARLASGRGLPDGVVGVLEITRLRSPAGPTTIDPATLAGRNLVLVDEGHRGNRTADGEWRRHREVLGRGGFVYEYSATFGGAATSELAAEYGRSIALAWPIARFHAEGYGKAWSILDLPDERPAARRRYLCAALVTLHEQLTVFDGRWQELSRLGFARPLAVFAGASVVGKADAERSDLLELLEFLAWFARGEGVDAELTALLTGSGLVDGEGRDVFAGRWQLGSLATGAELRRGILASVFGATGPGPLRLRRRDADGELALQLGDAPPCGVVAVGDAAGLLKKARSVALLECEGTAAGDSLFARLDEGELTLLLGSRRFAEGWDSWRVSVLGLLNLGRARGPQVVQLLGRGVRLCGEGASLRRTGRPDLAVLETLAVFGLRASWLQRFRAELAAAGLPAGSTEGPAGASARGVSRPGASGEHRIAAPGAVEGGHAHVVPWPRAGWSLPERCEAPAPGVPPVRVDVRARVLAWSAGSQEPPRAERGDVAPAELARRVDPWALRDEVLELKRRMGWHTLAVPRRIEGKPWARWLLEQTGSYELAGVAMLGEDPAAWQRAGSAVIEAVVRRAWRHASGGAVPK